MKNNIVPFGKYKGLTWKELEKKDINYYKWALENFKPKQKVVEKKTYTVKKETTSLFPEDYPPFKIYKSKDLSNKKYVCYCCLQWVFNRDKERICEGCLSIYHRDKIGRGVVRQQKRLINKLTHSKPKQK